MQTFSPFHFLSSTAFAHFPPLVASPARGESGADGKAGERRGGSGVDEDDPYGGSTDEASDMETDVVGEYCRW